MEVDNLVDILSSIDYVDLVQQTIAWAEHFSSGWTLLSIAIGIITYKMASRAQAKLGATHKGIAEGIKSLFGNLAWKPFQDKEDIEAHLTKDAQIPLGAANINEPLTQDETDASEHDGMSFEEQVKNELIAVVAKYAEDNPDVIPIFMDKFISIQKCKAELDESQKGLGR